MAEFKIKAKDTMGRMRESVINAPNKTAAKNRAAQMRLKVVTIAEIKSGKKSTPGLLPGEEEFLGGFLFKDEKGRIQMSGGDKIEARDIIIFSKQLSTMINSGVPLIQAIDLLGKQQTKRTFRKTLAQVRMDVENGAKLSDAFAAFPNIFNSLFISMIRAGETSGNLDTILVKLVEYIEKSERIKKQIKGAMVYPTIVIIVALGVVAGLLYFVVPTFAAQFKDAGKPLPDLTQFLVDLSDWFKANALYLFGGIVAAVFSLKMAAKTPRGQMELDKILLKVPLTGNLLRKVAVGRFCSTMSTMLGSGVNLLEALTICASSAGSKPIEEFVLGVRKKVEEGQKLSQPLAESTIFPSMVVSMIAVGENTGAIDDMMKKISDFYEEEVEMAVAAMLAAIEPILIVFLGGIIGFVVIALYLPVFDMAGTV